MAGARPDVGHDLGDPARRHGAADALGQRDPHVVGRPAPEGAEHQHVALQQVHADPVERRLVLVQAGDGSLDGPEVHEASLPAAAVPGAPDRTRETFQLRTW